MTSTCNVSGNNSSSCRWGTKCIAVGACRFDWCDSLSMRSGWHELGSSIDGPAHSSCLPMLQWAAPSRHCKGPVVFQVGGATFACATAHTCCCQTQTPQSVPTWSEPSMLLEWSRRHQPCPEPVLPSDQPTPHVATTPFQAHHCQIKAVTTRSPHLLPRLSTATAQQRCCISAHTSREQYHPPR